MSTFTKALCKYEVAEMLGVSPTTLRTWLNTLYYNELENLGYYRRQKKLTPKQLNFLHQKIDLQFEKSG